MTPPLPVPIVSDEYEPEREPPWRRWLSRLLAAWGTIRGVLSLVAAIAIVLALTGLAGYALGRHSVAPKPGEEARLDSAVAVLTHQRDSLRQVAQWEAATRKILEQKQAAAPRVEIREPGVIVIRPVGELEPRVVPVPVEVTQALSLERQINASLRVELDATRALAATETARADSLARAVALARAERPGFLSGRVALTVGYGVTSAGGVVRPGWQVGVGVALFRWP